MLAAAGLPSRLPERGQVPDPAVAALN